MITIEHSLGTLEQMHTKIDIHFPSFVTIYLKEKIYVLAGGFIQFQL